MLPQRFLFFILSFNTSAVLLNVNRFRRWCKESTIDGFPNGNIKTHRFFEQLLKPIGSGSGQKKSVFELESNQFRAFTRSIVNTYIVGMELAEFLKHFGWFRLQVHERTAGINDVND